MESDIGFNILQTLNSSHYTFSQTFHKKELKNAVHDKSLLIGIEYFLHINVNSIKTLLIFATPLEHQLATHIIFKRGTLMYHIEYNSQEYIVAHNQIQYLNDIYNILDSIEVELFEDLQYNVKFSKEFILHHPLLNQTSSNTALKQLHTIQVSDNLHSSSLLLIPHLYIEHAQSSIIQDLIPLNNILANSYYIEKLYEYCNLKYSSQHPTFAGAKIFQVIVNSVDTNHSNDEKLEIIEPNVDYHLKISPTSTCVLVSSKPSKYPLPLFLSSYNSFVEIANSDEFKSITGRTFSYSLQLFQTIIIKDKHSMYATYANLYLNAENEELLNSQPIYLYSTPKEYYLKKSLAHSTLLFKPTQDRFSIHIEQSINKIISYVQEAMIQNAQFPTKKSSTPLSYTFVYIAQELYEIIKQYGEFEEFEILESIHSKIITILSCIDKFIINFDELYELSVVLFMIFKMNSLYKLSLNIDEKFFNQFDEFKVQENELETLIQSYDSTCTHNYYQIVMELNSLFLYLQTVETLCVVEDERLNSLLKHTLCKIIVKQSNVLHKINLKSCKKIIQKPLISIYVQ
ncbi:MAG: hypothetical protein ACLFPL_02520 [Candidatus Nanoarchaeia archaeon]